MSRILSPSAKVRKVPDYFKGFSFHSAWTRRDEADQRAAYLKLKGHLARVKRRVTTVEGPFGQKHGGVWIVFWKWRGRGV